MPRLAHHFGLALAVGLVTVVARPPGVAGQPADAAARGLDVFVHVPGEAAPGASLPLQLSAYGFPTVTTLVPLVGAELSAAWDPESLGPGVASAPAPAQATADASGRVHLDVTVPEGDERTLRLLIGVRSGSHSRTRTVDVKRVRPHAVALHVGDRRVVPGGFVSAWVVVTGAGTGAPVAGAPLEVRLLEGGVARHTVRLTTDSAGTAMARVPVPRSDEPGWSWRLSARTLVGERPAGEDELTLTPRDETPGSAKLTASWVEDGVRAGDRAHWVVRVRDATDRPISEQALRVWIGPRGTEPPKEIAKWEAASTPMRTNPLGEIEAEATAPRTVASSGTSLRLVVRGEVEGRPADAEATLAVGALAATAELFPEGGRLVPGITQRLLVRVRDGHGKPVAGTFHVEADGLAARATTDAFGEAEVAWPAPADLGAQRDVGPCAGGVAARVSVRPEGAIAALGTRAEPFELCLPVDRAAKALVVVDPPLVRAGTPAKVRVVRSADASRGAPGPAAQSVVLRAGSGAQASGAWIADGDRGGELFVPAGARGAWSVSAASPGRDVKAALTGGGLVVVPKTLPRMTAKLAGGRAAPGGTVEIDADLTDERGAGLAGTVAAVVLDARGGGSATGLERLDTRRSICWELGVERERCDRFVEGDPTLDPLRRALLSSRTTEPMAPLFDPGGTAKEALVHAFGDVLRSLEGAVFEATASAERLRDVRRRAGGGFAFNPELMTLVTAAFSEPPVTPGGEPLSLADLVAIDPQVTFDHVARRVTRLKLFRVLAAVRAFRHELRLDVDEPALRDPNALLRRLVREGRLTEDALLDPWGGTLEFVKSGGPPIPFLTAVRGFELRAPGPDGRVGTGDDVKDPFERVLKSGSPYARAVGEDRLVDARYELEVGDATVEAWQKTLEELTGTDLGGRGEGIGLGSIGTVGHGSGTGTGQGFGSGHGRMGGSISTGIAYWAPPVRTDAQGHLRLRVPLGDIETTWRIVLVGVPDKATPATATLDVPVTVPLSARVEAGARWTAGDEVTAKITLRNRTDKSVTATVAWSAGGVAMLVDGKRASATVPIAAQGTATTTVRLRAAKVGKASLEVKTQAAGQPGDVLRHEWPVAAPGEAMALASAEWIDGERAIDLSAYAGRSEPRGPARLVFERGDSTALRAALDSLDPDQLATPEAMADAVEVAARLGRWAVARGGEGDPLAVRAGQIGRRAVGRLAAYGASTDAAAGPRWAALARAKSWAPEAVAGQLPKPASCPPVESPSLDVGLAGLDAEPPPTGGAVEACWDAFVTTTVGQATRSADAVAVARAVLALSERSHRSGVLASLVDRLRQLTKLGPEGGVVLSDAATRDRASRAIVYAALLRAARAGRPSPASSERLAAWLAVQRDSRGGYGSPLATRSVVRALLAAAPAPSKAPTRIAIRVGETEKTVTVAADASVVVPLGEASAAVVTTSGPGLLVRLERAGLRPWSRPPSTATPLHFEVAWPEAPRAGKTGTLRVTIHHDLGRATTVDARVPLPPGVTLAAKVERVRQVQGALLVRTTLDATDLPVTLELPVRFELAGRVTAPEARASLAFEDAPAAIAPARPLRITE